MVWLLILFVLAVALVPLTHFAPSKRQRAIAGLRERAALAGLFVEFREPPGGPDRPLPNGVRSRDLIYYGRRLPAAQKRARIIQGWRRDNEGWLGVGGYVPIPELFEELPDVAVAASVDPDSCGIYWDESGGIEMVDEIASLLDRWAEQLGATRN
ncbi:MAG: hypothetical protein HKN19_11565 [Halioglobus sp.]|nr:hypothetical protein [Halioglobus sp.]